MGPQSRHPVGSKHRFLSFRHDHGCHNTAFSKESFLKLFWKTKETKLVFNARKSSIGVGIFPTGERAQELCIALSDGYEIGSFSITFKKVLFTLD